MNRAGKNPSPIETTAATEPTPSVAAKSLVGRHDVALRLLQLVSMCVVFVFLLVGTSLHSVRVTTLSRPVLHHHVAAALPPHLRVSQPMYTSLVSLDLHAHRANQDDAALTSAVARQDPELLVVQRPPDASTLRAVDEALPRHRRIEVSAAPSASTESNDTAWETVGSVLVRVDVWRVREHGVLRRRGHNATAVAVWIRVQRETSGLLSPAILKHHDATLLLVVMSQDREPSLTKDQELEHLLLELCASQSSSVSTILTGDVTSLPRLADSLVLNDAFEHLQTPTASTSRVLASPSLRPVSASVLDSPAVVATVVVYEMRT